MTDGKGQNSDKYQYHYDMEGASPYAYISKQKLNAYQKHKHKHKSQEREREREREQAQARGRSRSRSRSRSGSRSVERTTEKELAGFGQMGLKVTLPPGTYSQEVDTNIIALKLAPLLEPRELARGNLFRCKACAAVMCFSSQATFTPQDDCWCCEFCGNRNKLLARKQDLPESNDLTFVLSAADQVLADEVPASPQPPKEISVVFCIDLSGSMNETMSSPVATHKYKRRPDRVSRLECVKYAIEQQLKQLLTHSPNMKVGFITFESFVRVIGDGTRAPVSPTASQEASYDLLMPFAWSIVGDFMAHPLAESHHTLMKNLDSFVTGGSTALGPGLLVSTIFAAAGKRGSKVIICTDGIANTGLGSLESPNDLATPAFYKAVGEYARAKGVSISVLSIVDQECRLDVLSPIANLTGGDVLKVDPQELHSGFSNVLAEKTLASGVEVQVNLHRAFEFRNEHVGQLPSPGVLQRTLGNVSARSVFSFEYSARKAAHLAALSDFDLALLSQVPFQAQIRYTGPDDRTYLRVVTRTQAVTFDKDEARKTANTDIVSAHARNTTAQLALKGDLRRAMVNALLYSGLATNVQEYQKELSSLYGAIQHESQTSNIIPDSQSDLLTAEINQALLGKKKYRGSACIRYQLKVS